MLMNLVINARDAMSDGGRLSIQTRAVDLPPERAAQLDVAPGECIRITVSDTGCGMDEHVRAHAFEPFFTTKPVGKGTGLGLSTVYGIVHSCHGAITVDSHPGAGTTFEIHLPHFRAEPLPVEPEFDRGAVVRGANTVLVVEDELAVRQFAVEVLAGSGHQMLQAANAEEALDVAARHNLPIDLLLTDMVMPGLNGRDLADRIRAIHPETRVLLVSGYSEVLAADGRLAAGFHYLQKPYTPESLTRTVERILSSAE
jgi:CheY-like chemotaxis protein